MKIFEFTKKIVSKSKSRLRAIFEYGRDIPQLLDIRKKVKNTKKEGKMSIVIELQTTNEFFYLKPVIGDLLKKGHFIFFTVRKKLRGAIIELTEEEFKNYSLKIIDISFTKKLPPVDFYINATLSYDIEVPENARYKISFPHTITSKTKYDVFSPSIEKISDFFVTGEVFLKDIETFCKDFNIKKIPKFHKIGCPKSDVIFGLKVDKKEFIKKIGLDPELPTVFYAPTWNPDTSIFTWRDEILSLTKRYRINMIVKVHPGAYIDPTNKKSSGGIDWKTFLESENLKKNRVVNAYQTDSPEYIAASDITITDISTIWIEYYFLKKPIIFLDIPKFFATHEKNSLGDFRDTYGYLVKTPNELDKILENIINKKIQPRNPPNIEDRLLYNKGHATREAVKKIEELFLIK